MIPQDDYFGHDVAATYDRDHACEDAGALARCVDTLAELANGGRVLEFAIGTGRVALPLAARGIAVSGIDMSAAMVREMTRKPGAEKIDVVVGDMTKARCTGCFSLVYLVFNTIDNLTTQEAQLACFRNAARHLEPDGRFLIETGLPPLQRLPFGETRLTFSHGAGHQGVDEFDIAEQTYTSSHEWSDGNGTRRLSIPFRYSWPAEMDLMARLAGLTLEHRWEDWGQETFTRHSTKHVSVWRKP